MNSRSDCGKRCRVCEPFLRSYLKVGSLNLLMADLRKAAHRLQNSYAENGRGRRRYTVHQRATRSPAPQPILRWRGILQSRDFERRTNTHSRSCAVRCYPGQIGRAEQQSQDDQNAIGGAADGLGSAQVSLCAIRVSAAQRTTLAVLSKEKSNFAGLGSGHMHLKFKPNAAISHPVPLSSPGSVDVFQSPNCLR
jgi:hypothetical protein